MTYLWCRSGVKMGVVVTMPDLAQAQIRVDAGDWSGARDIYAALLTAGESSDARLGLARTSWWMGDTRTALVHAERAVAAYEDEERFADEPFVDVLPVGAGLGALLPHGLPAPPHHGGARRPGCRS